MSKMKYLLFTTTTCPKCPTLKDFVVEKLDFEGEILDENFPDFAVRAREFAVESAPTLLIFDEEGRELFRGSEVSEVVEFLEKF